MSFTNSVLSASTVDLNDGNSTNDDTIIPITPPDDDDYEKYGIPRDKNTLISITEDLTGNKTQTNKDSDNTTILVENINNTNTTLNNTTTNQTSTNTTTPENTINTNTVNNDINIISTTINDDDQNTTIQTQEDLEVINSSTDGTVIDDLVNIEYQSEEEIGDISVGQETEVIIESQDASDTYIENLKFTPSKDFENVKVSIKYLTEKPEEVEQPIIKDNKPIYGYVDIKLTSNDIYIEEMSTIIKFNVKKEWIEKNNLDENSIVLIRYHNRQWEQLDTKLISLNNINIYYESITPGFSTFAVVGSSLVKIDDPYASSIMPEIPFEIMVLLIIVILLSLVYILFKSKYIYFKDEKTIDSLKEYQN